MAVIDVKFTDLQEDMEREYVRELQMVATRVFETSDDVVNRYVELLHGASPYERLLALHEAPINVISTLTGIPVTEEIFQRLALVRKHAESEQDKLSQLLASRQGLEKMLRDLGYVKIDTRKGFDTWQLADPSWEAKNKPTRVTVGPPAYLTPDGRELYDITFVADLVRHIYFRDSWPSNPYTLLPKLS